MTIVVQIHSPSRGHRPKLERLLAGGTALMLAFAVAAMPEAARAIDLSDLEEVKTPADIPKPADPSKCEITDKLADDWIKPNNLLKNLDRAYRAAWKDWNVVPLSEFGHDGVPNRDGLRTEAREILRQYGESLLKFAKQYAARKYPACDDCYALNYWGRLFYIRQLQQTLGPNGELMATPKGAIDPVTKQLKPADPVMVDVRNLSLVQITNPDVQKSVQTFLDLYEIRQKVKPDPQFTNEADLPVDKQAACKDGLVAKPTPDIKACTTTMINGHLNSTTLRIVQKLREVGNTPQGLKTDTKELLARSGKVICSPESELFPHKKWVIN